MKLLDIETTEDKIRDLESIGIKIIGKINPPYKIVVPFSGGKDSQTCLKIAVNEYGADNVLALFCDTGFEHPLTYSHVDATTKKYCCDLITLKAGTVKELSMKYKRLPGGGSRFCTEQLKIRPSKFFYKFLAKKQGCGFDVWLGMRSDESKAREKRYKGKLSTEMYAPNDILKIYPKYLEKMGVMFRLPVIDWARDEVFNYLDGEENLLYKQGFDRVGCFPCLAGGEKSQMKAFTYDETGRKHFNIAQEIVNISPRKEVLMTKKYYGQGGSGCMFCEI